MNTVWDAAKRIRLGSAQRWMETEFTVPTSIDRTKIELEMALLKRLYAFCRSHGIMLIIVDIPLRSQPDFLGSIPAALQNQFRENSDALILSEDVFAPYLGLTEFHGMHGTSHINEFSHLMLGIAVGQTIRTLLSECGEGRRSCAASAREKTGNVTDGDDGAAR